MESKKVVHSGRSGNDRLQGVKGKETQSVSEPLPRRRWSFPERSRGRQPGFEKRRQSLCAMHRHGSAGLSRLFCPRLTPECTFLWVRTLARPLIKLAEKQIHDAIRGPSQKEMIPFHKKQIEPRNRFLTPFRKRLQLHVAVPGAP